MITEDYVSFEVAKLLKEKGFNEPCHAYYDEDNGILRESYSAHAIRNIANPCFFGDAAPTLQMAMKWLREARGISIEITSIGYLVDYDVEWECDIKAAHKLYFKHITGEKSFESCANEAIKYCIVNLI